MSYDCKLNGSSIGSYVVGTVKAPYIKRNRSFELMSPGMSFEVSYAYGGGINLDDDVEFYSGSSCFYQGIVSKVEDNSRDRTYKIELDSHLLKLKNKTIEDDGFLVEKIRTGTGDNYGTQEMSWTDPNPEGQGTFVVTIRNVRLNWLLQCLFDQAGLSLDVSSLETNIYLREFDIFPYYLRDIFIDEKMLIALRGRGSTEDAKVSYWDFVRRVASCFRLVFVPTGISGGVAGFKAYSAITQDETFSTSDISNSNRFKDDVIEETSRANDSEGYIFEMTYKRDQTVFEGISIAYYGAEPDGQPIAPRDVDVILNDGEEKNIIEWIDHLVFLLRDKDAGGANILTGVTEFFDYSLGLGSLDFGLLDKYIESFFESYVQRRIEAPVNLTVKAVRESSVILSLKEQKQSILQEEITT